MLYDPLSISCRGLLALDPLGGPFGPLLVVFGHLGGPFEATNLGWVSPKLSKNEYYFFGLWLLGKAIQKGKKGRIVKTVTFGDTCQLKFCLSHAHCVSKRPVKTGSFGHPQRHTKSKENQHYPHLTLLDRVFLTFLVSTTLIGHKSQYKNPQPLASSKGEES